MLDYYLTCAVLISVLAALILTRLAPDLIFMAALSVLLFSGVLLPEEALKGFANPGVITIAVLYMVSAGLRESGAVQFMAKFLLGQPSSPRRAQARLFFPTALLSALLSNTAVVAMLIPAVQDWSRQIGMSASRLLLPMSYAAIVGGTMTLIGTSTNLVVDGMLSSQLDIHLGLFELAWVGFPLAIVAGLFMVFFANRLLPDRVVLSDHLERAREYAVEVVVSEGGVVAGKTIAEAGLRGLQYIYLAEIWRHNQLLASVGPQTTLVAGDRLCFVGAAEGAAELRRLNGLQPARHDVDKLALGAPDRHLIEAVIGPNFPCLGQSIRQAAFRSRYNAVVLAVSRANERLPGKLGDIELRLGDTLLLEGGEAFVAQYRFRRDFLLVSQLNDSAGMDFSKAPAALIILLLMAIVSGSGFMGTLEAVLLAMAAMLITRCITLAKARGSIDLSVIVVIAASFSLGLAMTKTGVARDIAGILLSIDGVTPWGALALTYLMTVVFTELVTNNAAAVLMFPIALSIAESLNVSPLPFAVAIMFAASASFIMPVGYQTNLMVMGPGGYKNSDYLRLGLPLSILVATVTIGLVPFVWRF